MQERTETHGQPEWPCHPDSFKATFLYKLPMFILGVAIGYGVYGLAKVLFG